MTPTNCIFQLLRHYSDVSSGERQLMTSTSHCAATRVNVLFCPCFWSFHILLCFLHSNSLLQMKKLLDAKWETELTSMVKSGILTAKQYASARTAYTDALTYVGLMYP